MSPLTALYLAFSQVSDPIWRVFLSRRLKKDKEIPERIDEKLGFSTSARPPGEVIWFHALSVGESLALLPLIDLALAKRPNAHLVLTTSTKTSAIVLERVGLPERVTHRLLPIDTAKATRRFLDHWRPQVAVFAELDFWPRLMTETYRREIPMVLVNSRMSETSLASRKRLRGMMRDILRYFDKMLLQDDVSQARFIYLGAAPEKISVLGALKAAGRPLPADLDELAELKTQIGDRPVWFAAATRDVEEPSMVNAHAKIVSKQPEALLIVAPRFLDSTDALEAVAKSRFKHIARRSRGERLDNSTEVYIADTMGEMGLWYRIAPVSFVGHSLGAPGKPLGGKNPFEAAALDSAILFGPAVEDFSESYEALEAANGAMRVHDADELAEGVIRLTKTELRETLCSGARSVVTAQAKVLDDTWRAIEDVL